MEREAGEGGEAPESTGSLPGLSSALFPFNIPMKIEVSGKIGRGRHSSYFLRSLNLSFVL